MNRQDFKEDRFKEQLREAFTEAVKIYFNNETLKGAVFIPQMVCIDGVQTVIVAAEPIIRLNNGMDRRGPERVKNAVKALLTQCQFLKERTNGVIPVFRTRPTIEIGGLNSKLYWDVAVWCDMNWAPAGTDITGFSPVWT